jgi:hypothetical protein
MEPDCRSWRDRVEATASYLFRCLGSLAHQFPHASISMMQGYGLSELVTLTRI